MCRRIQALFLCVVLSVSLTACNGQGTQDLRDTQEGSLDSEDGQDNEPDTTEEEDGNSSSEGSGEGTDSTPEPLLGEDATDEELLEVISDNITIVTDDNYIEMVTAFTENTEDYAGQIYQLEGSYTTEDGAPYVARTIVDGENKTPSGMPLKYVTSGPAEGAWIRVTGIVNKGEIDGKEMAVLEVIVLQELEEQGQAELPID